MEEKEVEISFRERILFYTLVGVMVSIVICLHYRPWKSYHDNNRLEQNGIATTAKLVEKKYTGVTKGVDLHRLILEYIPSKAVNKEKRIIDIRVDPITYNLGGVDNNRIPILYLVDDPDIIKLKNVEPRLRPLVECILLDLVMLGFGLYGVFSHFREKRKPAQME